MKLSAQVSPDFTRRGGRESASAAPNSIASMPLTPPARSGRVAGATETICAAAPVSSAFAIVNEPTTVVSDSAQSNASEMTTMHAPVSVNARKKSVNARGNPIARRLIPHIAEAARREPAKVLAMKTGISERVITDLREERSLPQLPTFFALAIHDPRLRAQAVAILTGDADANDPANIDRLVRSFTQRGSG